MVFEIYIERKTLQIAENTSRNATVCVFIWEKLASYKVVMGYKDIDICFI